MCAQAACCRSSRNCRRCRIALPNPGSGGTKFVSRSVPLRSLSNCRAGVLSVIAMFHQQPALVSSYKLESERRMQRSTARTIKNHPAILKNFAAGGSRTRYFAPARTSPSPNIRLDVAITPTRGENTEGRIKPSPNFCPIKTNAGYATPAKMRINRRMSGKSANFPKFDS